jgi:hypothetical protein
MSRAKLRVSPALTLAKWETVSGRFGGYFTLQVTCHRLGISLRRSSVHDPSYDRLKTQSPPRMVERGSRPTAKFASTVKQKDESALDVALPQEVIGELVIQAALRGMGLVELIAQVLCEAVKKDMVGTILDGEERPGSWRRRRTASVH